MPAQMPYIDDQTKKMADGSCLFQMNLPILRLRRQQVAEVNVRKQ